MAIGKTMHQFILDYHFMNQKLSTITLTCVIYIPQVSYMHCIYHFICVLHNIGSENVITEAVNALYNAFNDGASDDRAVKCCVSSHYNHNGRRRLVVSEATATNNQCKCVNNTLIFH